MPVAYQRARQVFRAHSGILRTHEALAAGIHRRTLYQMRDAGQLDLLSRGVYRLAKMPPLSDPDLATVGKRVPSGVICLISALEFHQLTTQIPHVVHLALPRNTRTPRLDHPPLQIYRFSGPAYSAGIERHEIEGVSVRVYCIPKTLADCFKYRNKIGLDIALEALRNYLARREARLQQVLEYARVCRVEKIMRPYLEATA